MRYTAMYTKRTSYFLILLLFWGFIDDAWTVVPASPSEVADSDDEYLPVEREVQSQRSVRRKQAVTLDSWRPTNNNAGALPNDSPDPIFARAASPSPLFLFMSLQC
jgi:hypothetical protein